MVSVFICSDNNCIDIIWYILMENYLLYLFVTDCIFKKKKKAIFPLLGGSWQQVPCNLHVEWGRNTAATTSTRHWGVRIRLILITVISPKWPNLFFTGEKVPNQFKIAMMHKSVCCMAAGVEVRMIEKMFQKQQEEKLDGRNSA